MSEFLYLDVLRISRRLILSFRSCFRIFPVVSVRTVFYTVIFPPPCPKFRFPRVHAVDSSFPLRFLFRIVFLPAIFSKFSVFLVAFSPPRRSSFRGLFPALRGICAVVCCVILLPFFRCPAAFISALSLNRLYPSISPLSSAFPPPAAAVFSAFFPS